MSRNKELKRKISELDQELVELESKKRELEKQVERKKREIDGLAKTVEMGKKVYVLIKQGVGYTKVKGTITIYGIKFKYMGKKWEVPFNPEHLFYMKHGLGKPKLTVYVDLDKVYSVPPPNARVSVEREIDSRAIQPVLTIYRSILFGQRREQVALMVGLLIAMGGLLVASITIYEYNHSIVQVMHQLNQALHQLNQALKQYPNMPQPTPGNVSIGG